MEKYVRWLLVTMLYLGCAQFAFLAFLQNPGNPHDFEKARLTDMVDGSAHRPFVYRILLPSTVRLIEGSLPEVVRSSIADLTRTWTPLRTLFAATPAAEEIAPVTYLTAYALEFVSLIAFALTLRAGILHFHRPPLWLANVLPAAAVACLPSFYQYISYDYDFPQLFLFTLGLLLLAHRDWRWFYPVFFLVTLNKETAVLLVLVHLLGHRAQMPRGRLIAHCVAQLFIVALVRSFLQFVAFPDNPGSSVEVWYTRNWELIIDVRRWGFLFFDFAWVGKTSLVVPTRCNVLFLLLVPLIRWKWSEQPILLRRGLWIAPVLLVAIFCFGYIDEMRNYYEVYPVVFLLVAGTICRVAKSVSTAGK